MTDYEKALHELKELGYIANWWEGKAKFCCDGARCSMACETLIVRLSGLARMITEKEEAIDEASIC
jgi:hypothetical protein